MFRNILNQARKGAGTPGPASEALGVDGGCVAGLEASQRLSISELLGLRLTYSVPKDVRNLYESF